MAAAGRWCRLALAARAAPVALVVYAHVDGAAVCADGGAAGACGPCRCHGQTAVARVVLLLLLLVELLIVELVACGLLLWRLLQVRRLLLLLWRTMLLLLLWLLLACICLHWLRHLRQAVLLPVFGAALTSCSRPPAAPPAAAASVASAPTARVLLPAAAPRQCWGETGAVAHRPGRGRSGRHGRRGLR